MVMSFLILPIAWLTLIPWPTIPDSSITVITITLRKSIMALENGPFISDFPNQKLHSVWEFPAMWLMKPEDISHKVPLNHN